MKQCLVNKVPMRGTTRSLPKKTRNNTSRVWDETRVKICYIYPNYVRILRIPSCRKKYCADRFFLYRTCTQPRPTVSTFPMSCRTDKAFRRNAAYASLQLVDACR